MKKTIMFFTFFICAILTSTNTHAFNIGKELGRSKVSHLELLANNLNMMFLITKAQEYMEKVKEKPKESVEIENYLTRYSASKDYRLIIEDFYKEPVAQVTNKKCEELLSKLSETTTGDDSTLSKLIAMLSATKLTISQAKQIADDAYLVVYVQAIENSQLSLNCSK